MATPDQEVIEAIQNKEGFTGDALRAARVLTDAAAALLENYTGGSINMPLKVFRGGIWETVALPLNIAQGDVSEKAVAKALAGLLSSPVLITASAAVGGVVATAGVPFIISFGATLAFAYYAGSAISEAVDKAYDIIIGPDFSYDDKFKIIEVDYTLKEAITANEGWFHNESFKKIISGSGLDRWTLISKKGGRIEFENNTFEFVGQALSTLREEKSLLDLTAMEIHPFGDFNLKITNGSTYKITNLLKKTSSQISSLAKSDSSVLYALANLKSYAIQGDSVSSSDFTDSYIDDKASMLYWHNMGKIHKLGTDAVERELKRYNIKDWFLKNSRIETISFSDNSILDIGSIMQLAVTQENDIIELNDENNTINSLGGDDQLIYSDTPTFNTRGANSLHVNLKEVA